MLMLNPHKSLWMEASAKCINIFSLLPIQYDLCCRVARVQLFYIYNITSYFLLNSVISVQQYPTMILNFENHCRELAKRSFKAYTNVLFYIKKGAYRNMTNRSAEDFHVTCQVPLHSRQQLARTIP